MPRYSVSVNRLLDAENEEVAIKSFKAVQNNLPVTCFKYGNEPHSRDGVATWQDLVGVT